MSAGWAAAGVRARALAHRRLGADAARRLAAGGSLSSALQQLATSPYGGYAGSGQSLGEAQHGLAASVLWNLRVLAGWLPRGGVLMLRVLAGWFEIANTDEQLQAMSGRAPAAPFRLGALATCSRQLAQARAPAGLRAALSASAWGDPGGDSPHELRIGMRARWLARVADLPAPAPEWAAGAAALLIAGERFTAGRRPSATVTAATAGLLGRSAPAAASLGDLAARLPGRAAWALADARSPADLWQAGARWWARVERDGLRLLRGSGFDSGPVLGAAAVLAADAWRTGAALEIAARGGQPMEAYDAVA